jgi:hypothetical protein
LNVVTPGVLLFVLSLAFSLPTPCEYFPLKLVQFLYRAGTTAPAVRTEAEPAVTAFDAGAAANAAAASMSAHAAARAVFLICTLPPCLGVDAYRTSAAACAATTQSALRPPE